MGRAFLLIVCLSTLWSVARVGAARYEVTRLSAPGTVFESQAYSLNNRGQVVGWADRYGGNLRAFLWQEGSMTILDLPGAHGAYDINDTAQVVGWTYNGDCRAVVWENGTTIEMGTLPGYRSSTGFAINDLGQVVASSGNHSANMHAFIWDPVDGMQDLRTLPLGTASEAHSINNSGQVVGWSLDGSAAPRAFLWENGVMLDLNGLIPADSGWILKEARAINDFGQIVGWGRTCGGPVSRGPRTSASSPHPDPLPLGVQPPGEGTCVCGRGRMVGGHSGLVQPSPLWTVTRVRPERGRAPRLSRTAA